MRYGKAVSRFAALVFAALIAAPPLVAQQGGQAEVLLQAAMHMEQVEGDLEQAIQLYRELIERHAGNRVVAAKALVYLGRCHEKLGSTEAQRAYDRVLREYGDQTEMVAEARRRLAALKQSTGTAVAEDLTIRQAWAGPDVEGSGAVSPDGKYISYVDWINGTLGIREMATGEKHSLMKTKGWEESPPGYPFTSRWSPDSRQLVYLWVTPDDGYELRTVGLDGSEPRILLRSEKETWVEPADWSPDGKYILVGFLMEDKSVQLSLISVADGSVRILKTFYEHEGQPTSGGLFSPDGRYIAYDRSPSEESAERDIFLFSIEGGYELPLITHLADDYFLGWAPDGKSILFASERTGTMDAWIIQVADGKPQGAPSLLRRNIGEIGPLGFTQEGAFYYSTQGLMYDVYTTTFDPESGRIITPPEKEALPYEGSNMSPDWSPHGKYLVYISIRSGPERNITSIFSADDGTVRELPHKLRLNYPRWAPDGRSILVKATVGSGGGIYRIDTQTGEVIPLIEKEGEEDIHSPILSHDGKSLFYIREYDPEELYQILVRDLETGEEVELYRTPPFDNSTIALSPDGLSLAIAMRVEEQVKVVTVMPSVGGEPREVYRFEQGGRWYVEIDWSPDGRYIYFSKGPDPDLKWELWRVPSVGGAAQNLGLIMQEFQFLSVHPDGRRITFASRPPQGAFQNAIWVMENFLPPLEEKQERR